MFERFTASGRRVIVLAQENTHVLDHGFCGSEHILLGLLGLHDGLVAEVLSGTVVIYEAVLQEVRQRHAGSATSATGAPPFTPRAKLVIQLAKDVSPRDGCDSVGPEHLLLALLSLGEGTAVDVMVDLGADLSTLRDDVLELGTGETAPESSTWSRRYKANVARLKTGDPQNIADVVESLTDRDRTKGLSQGERRMLERAKSMLAETPGRNTFLPEP
jgi:ATP-dependent Clp protease ATP-binding subunit ClpC